MKKFILLSCLIPCVSFATNVTDSNRVAVYQELCAKEQDPVKRKNYCYMLERDGKAQTMFNVFRKDIAVV